MASSGPANLRASCFGVWDHLRFLERGEKHITGRSALQSTLDFEADSKKCLCLFFEKVAPALLFDSIKIKIQADFDHYLIRLVLSFVRQQGTVL